jgi:hypothetical protein
VAFYQHFPGFFLLREREGRARAFRERRTMGRDEADDRDDGGDDGEEQWDRHDFGSDGVCGVPTGIRAGA